MEYTIEYNKKDIDWTDISLKIDLDNELLIEKYKDSIVWCKIFSDRKLDVNFIRKYKTPERLYELFSSNIYITQEIIDEFEPEVDMNNVYKFHNMLLMVLACKVRKDNLEKTVDQREEIFYSILDKHLNWLFPIVNIGAMSINMIRCMKDRMTWKKFKNYPFTQKERDEFRKYIDDK